MANIEHIDLFTGFHLQETIEWCCNKLKCMQERRAPLKIVYLERSVGDRKQDRQMNKTKTKNAHLECEQNNRESQKEVQNVSSMF